MIKNLILKESHLQCHLYKLAVEKNVFVLIGLISQ